MSTTCKCGVPLFDSDDGICKKCCIRQVYEMDNPGPRWQTLAEALPVYGEGVCVQRQVTRFTACYLMRDGFKIWQVRAPLGAGSLYHAHGTDRWHPWPGEGKK